ncbi:uncharacterized protein LOC134204980 [Armigeres subalbatus]|uniref:uncharacterized protein LOC134204980 n=1 Tax=Armigeres subalbatus TaxID=124917 RepID=UPI002ED25656
METVALPKNLLFSYAAAITGTRRVRAISGNPSEKKDPDYLFYVFLHCRWCVELMEEVTNTSWRRHSPCKRSIIRGEKDIRGPSHSVHNQCWGLSGWLVKVSHQIEPEDVPVKNPESIGGSNGGHHPEIVEFLRH